MTPKPEDTATRSIKDDAIEACRLGRTGEIASRYALGRCVIALQALNGDVGGNSRPTYAPARKVVLAWTKEVNGGISDNVLIMCTYVALRLSQAQVDVCLTGSMTFCQIYGMLRIYKDNRKRVTQFLSDIADGNGGKLSRFTQPEKVDGRVQKRKPDDHGDKLSNHEVRIPLYDPEARDVAILSLLSQVQQEDLCEWLNGQEPRVEKTQGKLRKRWGLV